MAAPTTPRRVPPPPQLAKDYPELNRWLQDLTAFIDAAGGVDPGSIAGFAALFAQVALNTAHIATLTTNLSTLSGTVAGNTTNITTLTTNLAALTAHMRPYR